MEKRNNWKVCRAKTATSNWFAQRLDAKPAPEQQLVSQAENAPAENCRRLVLLGSARVGKTAIVTRFLGARFVDSYTPTIEDFHRKVYRIRGEPYRLDILDTSGNHPFPAMRRISLLTGDLFLLVYSIDSRDSFNETKRLLEQLLQVKQQATGKAVRTVPKPVLFLVANKTDKEQERDVPFHELKDLADSYQGCGYIEMSAKCNRNVDEAFAQLFDMASLPSEMSPSLHRKVLPGYVSSTRCSPVKRGLSLRRRVSEACGAIAPNARRPSIRTDLLLMQHRQVSTDKEVASQAKCTVQ